MNSPTIVYLVHPHSLERAAVAEWLMCNAFIEVTGKSGNLEEIANSSKLDTAELLIAFTHSATGRASQITNIKKMHPALKIMIASDTSAVGDVREIVHSGVSGYIDFRAEIEEWERAIKLILAGKMYYAQQVMTQLAKVAVGSHTIQHAVETKNSLSKREIEVLRLVASEYTTNRIADELFISNKTVETHRRNLFQKLEVKNSVGLVKIAVRLGII